MNTKILLTVTSAALALAGVLALFAPELVVGSGLPPASPAPALVQLLGALYLAFAAVNWIARESVIGGVYARPISLGNFAHFIVGALILAKYVLGGAPGLPAIGALLVYAAFAIIFGWLVFVATGLPTKTKPPATTPSATTPKPKP